MAPPSISRGAEKAPDAFRTIGELSSELGVAQHILRYWETKFPQLKPLQRAGNRRYYRPDDVALARRIHGLLNQEGYTVKGVQKVLRQKEGGGAPTDVAASPARTPVVTYSRARPTEPANAIDVPRLTAIRDRLAEALRG